MYGAIKCMQAFLNQAKENGGKVNQDDIDLAYLGAISRNKTDFIEWLSGQGYTSATAMYNAALAGDIELLQWFNQHGFEQSENLFDAAASDGQISILEWLQSNNVP